MSQSKKWKRVSLLVGGLAFAGLGTAAYRVRAYLQDPTKPVIAESAVLLDQSLDSNAWPTVVNQNDLGSSQGSDYQRSVGTYGSYPSIDSSMTPRSTQPVAGYAPMRTAPSSKEDAEIQQLVQQLRRNLRASPGDGNQEARIALSNLLEKQLEHQIATQESELNQLQNRLTEARSKLDTRKKRRSEIIARRIQQLLGEPNELDWEVNAPNSSPYGVAPSPSTYNTPNGYPSYPSSNLYSAPRVSNPRAYPDSGLPVDPLFRPAQGSDPSALPEFVNPTVPSNPVAADTPTRVSPPGMVVPVAPTQETQGTIPDNVTLPATVPAAETTFVDDRESSRNDLAISTTSQMDQSLSLWMQSVLKKTIEIEAALEATQEEQDVEKRNIALKSQLPKSMRIVELEFEQIRKLHGPVQRAADRKATVAKLRAEALRKELATAHVLREKHVETDANVNRLELQVKEAMANVEQAEDDFNDGQTSLENLSQRVQDLRKKLDEARNDKSPSFETRG